jgi:hypothetical protein
VIAPVGMFAERVIGGCPECGTVGRHIHRDTFRLPITTELALREFVRCAWGVTLPDHQCCPQHTTPWRAFADAYFARHPIVIWKGSRGFSGKSFTLALLGATEAATLGADVVVLGGSGAQSETVHSAMRRFWTHRSAPYQLLVSDPIMTETRFRAGNSVRALPASSKAVRGPHPQRLRGDEIDEMEIDILEAAMGQTMKRDGIRTQTVLCSTHQYVNGTMSSMLRRAQDRGWPVYEWCYRETMQPHGWLEPEEISRKQGEVSERMWDIEYELGRPTSLEDSCFPMYGDVHQAALEYDPALMLLIGIDYGYRTFAATIAQLDTSRNRPMLRIIGDAELHGMTTVAALVHLRDVILPRILPREAIERSRIPGDGVAWWDLIGLIGADPAGDKENPNEADFQETKRIFHRCPVRKTTTPKYRNPEWGAEKLRMMLAPADGIPQILVDPVRAPYIHRCLEGLRYPKHNDGTPERKQPLKDGVLDHGFDSLRYLCVNVGGLWRTATEASWA